MSKHSGSTNHVAGIKQQVEATDNVQKQKQTIAFIFLLFIVTKVTTQFGS